MNLEWNVWCNDLNTNKIKSFNILIITALTKP